MMEWNIKQMVTSMTGKKETPRKLLSGDLQHLSAYKETIIEKKEHRSGDICSNGDVTVYGSVTGNIESKQDVYIFGRVKGDIKTSYRIILHTGAEVEGNLSASSLSIEQGAILHGTCDIS